MQNKLPFPQKTYPRNDAYNFQIKPAFNYQNNKSNSQIHRQNKFTSSNQQTLGYQQTQKMMKQSFSIYDNKYVYQKERKQQIMSLHQRIQYLQQQLEQVIILINESDQYDDNQSSKNNEISYKLQESYKQLHKLQAYSKQLNNNLKKTQQLNVMLQNQLRISQKNNEELRQSFEKISNQLDELKKQIGSDENTKQRHNKNIEQRDQIESILEKFHALNLEYNTLQQEKEELVHRVESYEGKKHGINIERELEQYKQRYETSQEQICYLKEQISKISEVSIQNQRQIIQKYEKQLASYKKDHKSPKESNNNKNYHEISNKIQELQKIITQKQTQIQKSRQQSATRQTQLLQEAQKFSIQIDQLNRDYQHQINQLKSTISQLQQNNQAEHKQKTSLEIQKSTLMNQLNQMKNTLQIIQDQVKRVVQVKQSYAKQINQLRQVISNLRRSQQQGISRINKLQSQKMYEKQLQNQKIQNQRLRQQIRHKYENQKGMLNRKIEQLENNVDQFKERVQQQKRQKERQRQKYKGIIQQYKQINEQISKQIKNLRENQYKISQKNNYKHVNNPEKVLYYDNRIQSSRIDYLLAKQQNLRLNRQLEKSQIIIKTLQKQMYQIRFTAFQIKTKNNQDLLNFGIYSPQNINSSINNDVIQKLQKKQQQEVAGYKQAIRILENNIENLTKQYNEWKHRTQLQYSQKLQLQRTQIINQYKTILHRRQSQESINYNSIPIQKLKYHPQFRKLSEQIVQLNKQLLTQEQQYFKKIDKINDQINKLQIQNNFHKQNMHQMLGSHKNDNIESESPHFQHYYSAKPIRIQDKFIKKNYKVKNPYSEQEIHWKSQYQEVSQQYKQLYDDYVKIKKQIFEPQTTKNYRKHQQLDYYVKNQQHNKMKPFSRLMQSKQEAMSLQISGKYKGSDGNSQINRENDILQHEGSIHRSHRNQLIAKIKNELSIINNS